MEFLWAFLPLCILLVAWFISNYYKYTIKNDLQEKIAWLSKRDLFFCVNEIQNNMSAPSCCKLTLTEESFARLILKQFAQQRQQDFIDEKLPYNRKTSKMTNECYFMYSLCDFLSEQDFGHKFLGNDLCNVVEHKTLSGTATWGGRRWEETCELTTFGKTFCKLGFVSMRYCEIHSAKPPHDSEAIKENLLSGKINFFKL